MNTLCEASQLKEGQFHAKCECCEKDFVAESYVGGHTICNKCYPIWFKGVLDERNQIKEIYGWDEDVNDDFIDAVKEREEVFKKYHDNDDDCPSAMKMIDTLNEEHDKTFSENVELKEEIKRLKKMSDIKTDLNTNLLREVIRLNYVLEGEPEPHEIANAIQNGATVSKDYGNNYDDEWNKIYNKLVQDLLEKLNRGEDFHGVGLHAQVRGGFRREAALFIEFVPYSEDEESDEED